MKVIDLLNKIANGKEVPKEIYYKNQWWKYNPENDYEGTEYGGCFLNNVLICDLNDEVKIIEEEKDINFNDIEEFHISYNLGFINYRNIDILKEYLNKDFQTIFDTLDLLINNQKKLIKEVNELKNR